MDPDLACGRASWPSFSKYRLIVGMREASADGLAEASFLPSSLSASLCHSAWLRNESDDTDATGVRSRDPQRYVDPVSGNGLFIYLSRFAVVLRNKNRSHRVSAARGFDILNPLGTFAAAVKRPGVDD